MENFESLNNNESNQLPTFLKVLCILTFVGSGIGSFSSLFTPPFADQIIAFMEQAPNMDEVAMAQAIIVLKAGWGYYIPMFLLSVGSIIGAIFMWKRNKIGFHIYALSNAAILFVPTLMLSIAISWFGVFLTTAFIVLYAMNLKHLK